MKNHQQVYLQEGGWIYLNEKSHYKVLGFPHNRQHGLYLNDSCSCEKAKVACSGYLKLPTYIPSLLTVSNSSQDWSHHGVDK